MTCIVAVSDGSRVWVGADSAYSNGGGTGVGLECKLLRVSGEVVLGFAGELGSASALRRWAGTWSPLLPDWPAERYVNEDLVPRIAEILREAGRTVSDRGTERMEIEMLVAVRSEIFHVTPSFAVFRPELPYMAIGTGAPYALGVMYALCAWADREDSVRLSLEAATRFCPSVRPPYSVLCTAAEEAA